MIKLIRWIKDKLSFEEEVDNTPKIKHWGIVSSGPSPLMIDAMQHINYSGQYPPVVETDVCLGALEVLVRANSTSYLIRTSYWGSLSSELINCVLGGIESWKNNGGSIHICLERESVYHTLLSGTCVVYTPPHTQSQRN